MPKVLINRHMVVVATGGLKGQSPCSCIAVTTKSLKIVIIFNHLMLVDTNNDSVTIPRWLWTVALRKNYRAHFGHPPISKPGSTPLMSIEVRLVFGGPEGPHFLCVSCPLF